MATSTKSIKARKINDEKAKLKKNIAKSRSTDNSTERKVDNYLSKYRYKWRVIMIGVITYVLLVLVFAMEITVRSEFFNEQKESVKILEEINMAVNLATLQPRLVIYNHNVFESAQ